MPNTANLLPQDRRSALAREYWLRLATVVAVAVAVLVLIHAVLLLPSFVYLSEEVETRQAHLSDVRALFNSSEEQSLGARAAETQTQAAALLVLASLPEAVPVIETVLNESRTQVRVTALSITPSLEGGEAKLSVSGIAATREALRRYYEALAGLPFVSGADLPLSVYATEADLPFTITLTGTLP